MTERNYEKDLDQLFDDADRIIRSIKQCCKSIYDQNELDFGEYAFRPVEGDVYTKVLGRYLKLVLGQTAYYEAKLVGRTRADIQFGDKVPKVLIEVKSHGQFDSQALVDRFKKLTSRYSTEQHIYIAFREREDYVKKTAALLNPLGVTTYFFSSYKIDPSKTLKDPETLRKLIEALNEGCQE